MNCSRARPGASSGAGSGASSRLAAAHCLSSISSAAVRSAMAEMVSDGFASSAHGTTEPSQTYNPSWTPPLTGSNTRPLWSTTPPVASSAITHPPSGCTVISDRSCVQAQSGSGVSIPCSAAVASASSRLSRANAGCSPHSGQTTWIRSFSIAIRPPESSVLMTR